MLWRVDRSAVSAPLDYLLKHTFFQLRKNDEDGETYHPRGRAMVSVAVNRAVVERGLRAPWMWSAERCQRFWATLESGEDPNAPNTYAAKPPEIVHFLHEFWRPEVTPADAVLEVGCNAGANLAHLRDLDYANLGGVEINGHAIAEMRSVFPALAAVAAIRQGRLEETLPALDSGAVDVVFAMAVLHHIHPSSRFVFAEMARIARRYVCVIEPEQIVSHYVFCRDYRRVFEGLGCTQVRAVEIGRSSFPDVADEYHGYTARLFRVPSP